MTMIESVRARLRNWCAWLIYRLNDFGAILSWLLLNTQVLPPELLVLLPAPVRMIVPALWWALVKWAAHKKATGAVAKAVEATPDGR